MSKETNNKLTVVLFCLIIAFGLSVLVCKESLDFVIWLSKASLFDILIVYVIIIVFLLFMTLFAVFQYLVWEVKTND